ncbi:helix-turn-helix domain-containing protein [Enterococcus faecium]|uniref:helix-turn-helix domain-containing protein n=1 Tax=Enterococcus faecium TaxID=1352 RepID=UPI000BF03F9F|nr:helix-turn-helix transcriptional regulator [Enterococcus faecium]PEH48935.1 transcriptional regulator [Enterococcus faecium]
MDVLNRIKELAKEKNISLAELERRTGLSSGSITKWNKSAPSADKLAKIADYLGVTTDYLLGRNQAPKWASKDELVELDKLLESNVNMSYGGETLSPEQIQRVKDILIATFWDIVKEDKEKGKKM